MGGALKELVLCLLEGGYLAEEVSGGVQGWHGEREWMLGGMTQVNRERRAGEGTVPT